MSATINPHVRFLTTQYIGTRKSACTKGVALFLSTNVYALAIELIQMGMFKFEC